MAQETVTYASVAAAAGDSGGWQAKRRSMKALLDINRKTELCHNFEDKGSCPYGDNCAFAHGVEELRQMNSRSIPDATKDRGDPSTERRTPHLQKPSQGTPVVAPTGAGGGAAACGDPSDNGAASSRQLVASPSSPQSAARAGVAVRATGTSANNNSGDTGPQVVSMPLAELTKLLEAASAQAARQAIQAVTPQFDSIQASRGRGRVRGGKASSPQARGLRLERGRRWSMLLPATVFWIDPVSPKDEERKTIEARDFCPHPRTCPVMAASFHFIRFDNLTESERLEKLSSDPTSYRSEHTTNVVQATYATLIALLDTTMDILGDEPLTTYDLVYSMHRSAIDAAEQGYDEQEHQRSIVEEFGRTFFKVTHDGGHHRACDRDRILIYLSVYNCLIKDFAHEVFLPIILAALGVTQMEPVLVPLAGEREGPATASEKVRWQINEVYGEGGSSTYPVAWASWVQLTWEAFKAFVFAEGRPAHFLLSMDPKDVTEEHAIKAFSPYITDPEGGFYVDEDDSEDEHNGGEEDDDDDDNNNNNNINTNNINNINNNNRQGEDETQRPRTRKRLPATAGQSASERQGTQATPSHLRRQHRRPSLPAQPGTTFKTRSRRARSSRIPVTYASAAGDSGSWQTQRRSTRALVGQNRKTELCHSFEDKGSCPYGAHCLFAHGVEELKYRTSRERQMNSRSIPDATKDRGDPSTGRRTPHLQKPSQGTPVVAPTGAGGGAAACGDPSDNGVASSRQPAASPSSSQSAGGGVTGAQVVSMPLAELTKLLEAASAQAARQAIQAVTPQFDIKQASRGRGRERGGKASSPQARGLRLERGRRWSMLLPATVFWIDPVSPKDEERKRMETGDVCPHPRTCPVMAASFHFIRFDNLTESERLAKLRSDPTSYRSEHTTNVVQATHATLIALLDTTMDILGDEPLTTHDLVYSMHRSALDAAEKGFDEQEHQRIVEEFGRTFFKVTHDGGHHRACDRDRILTYLSVYHCLIKDFAHEVFLPIILAALGVTQMEPVLAPLPGEREGPATTSEKVRWQINEVYGEGGSSTYPVAWASWVQLTWEAFKAFVFAEGRPAHFLLSMAPKDVTEEHAIKAFSPYITDPEGGYYVDEDDSEDEHNGGEEDNNNNNRQDEGDEEQSGAEGDEGDTDGQEGAGGQQGGGGQGGPEGSAEGAELDTAADHNGSDDAWS